MVTRNVSEGSHIDAFPDFFLNDVSGFHLEIARKESESGDESLHSKVAGRTRLGESSYVLRRFLSSNCWNAGIRKLMPRFKNSFVLLERNKFHFTLLTSAEKMRDSKGVRQQESLRSWERRTG